MQKLNALAFAAASAIALMALTVLCAIGIAASPDATFSAFGVLMHGLDITPLKSAAAPTMGQTLGSVAGWGAVGFVAGYLIALTYNLAISR